LPYRNGIHELRPLYRLEFVFFQIRPTCLRLVSSQIPPFLDFGRQVRELGKKPGRYVHVIHGHEELRLGVARHGLELRIQELLLLLGHGSRRHLRSHAHIHNRLRLPLRLHLERLLCLSLLLLSLLWRRLLRLLLLLLLLLLLSGLLDTLLGAAGLTVLGLVLEDLLVPLDDYGRELLLGHVLELCPLSRGKGVGHAL
jgi:hypothetical protein